MYAQATIGAGKITMRKRLVWVFQSTTLIVHGKVLVQIAIHLAHIRGRKLASDMFCTFVGQLEIFGSPILLLHNFRSDFKNSSFWFAQRIADTTKQNSVFLCPGQMGVSLLFRLDNTTTSTAIDTGKVPSGAATCSKLNMALPK